MAEYSIEFKTYAYPYFYEYFGAPKDDPYGPCHVFNSLADARKKAMSLIKNRTAIVCVIHGKNVKKLVYITESGSFVCEDRLTRKWNHLNKDGTLGPVIKNVDRLGIVQSHWKEGKYIF